MGDLKVSAWIAAQERLSNYRPRCAVPAVWTVVRSALVAEPSAAGETVGPAFGRMLGHSVPLGRTASVCLSVGASRAEQGEIAGLTRAGLCFCAYFACQRTAVPWKRGGAIFCQHSAYIRPHPFFRGWGCPSKTVLLSPDRSLGGLPPGIVWALSRLASASCPRAAFLLWESALSWLGTKRP